MIKKQQQQQISTCYYVAYYYHVDILVPLSLDGIENNARGFPL